MRVFITGATGFIGSAIVQEFLADGHEVVGLARSEEAAKALTAAGAQVHRGDVEDLESLRSGAKQSDGVIHCGFVHDFARFQEVCEIDRRAIEAMGETLVGSDRPFLVSSGTGIADTPGRASTEDDPANSPMPRVASEQAADKASEQGAHVVVIRLPQVHTPEKQGLITPLIEIARAKGVSAYVGDGQSRWPAAHRSDVARLYKLAFEKGEAGARYNAVGEEGVAIKDIAEVIGRGLKVPVVGMTPEEAAEQFGWLGAFMSHDRSASSALTQQRLGWHPTGVSLLTDLEEWSKTALN